MRRRWQHVFLLVLQTLLIPHCYGTPLLVNQALKGRVFGSPRSDDVAKRIAVDGDGSVYVAGVTTPHDGKSAPWGDIEAGALTGKSDVFIAKFSRSSHLIWVRRIGSSEDDIVNDLQVSATGLYICGHTEGRLGRVQQGSADAFIMKISLNGEKMWRHIYQFGSRGHDSCHSLHVNPTSTDVYVAGNTNGRMFGNESEDDGSIEYFVAHFKEFVGDGQGLKLLKGRQKGSHGSCSGDSIGFGGDNLLVMTSNWDDHWDKKKSRTFLNVLDAETLELKHLHAIQSEKGLGFRGTGMVTQDKSDEVFMVGISASNVHSHAYHALMIKPYASTSTNDSGGVVRWATQVGTVFPKAKLVYQTPSIALDTGNGLVYIAGVEDGFFTDGSNESGIVSVPFYKLNMRNGTVEEKWQRTALVPFEREELTGIAVDPGKAVVYTGVLSGKGRGHASVVIGSFGSPGQAKRAGSFGSESFAHAGGEGTPGKSVGSAEIAGYVVLGLCGVGIVWAGLFLIFRKRSRRGEQLEEEIEEQAGVGGNAAPS